MFSIFSPFPLLPLYSNASCFSKNFINANIVPNALSCFSGFPIILPHCSLFWFLKHYTNLVHFCYTLEVSVAYWLKIFPTLKIILSTSVTLGYVPYISDLLICMYIFMYACMYLCMYECLTLYLSCMISANFPQYYCVMLLYLKINASKYFTME